MMKPCPPTDTPFDSTTATTRRPSSGTIVPPAQAAADLLGPDVKTLAFDGATIASDPSVTVEFRSKVGGHAVWIKVTTDGDRLKAEKVLDQRP